MCGEVMLLEFRVKNFKSIKEEVVLSTTRLTDKSSDQNIIPTENKISPKVLKSILITGPNASGKSNVLEAIYFMHYFINNNLNLKPGEKINQVAPFKLDDLTKDEPSEFEVSLLIENIVYTYGFSLTKSEIYTEYLYYYKSNKKITIFQRTKQDFIFEENELKNEQEQLKTRVSENKLYLSVSASWNFEISNNIIKYLRDKFNFINENTDGDINILKEIQKSKEFKDKLLDTLRAVDFGIKGLKVFEENMPKDDLEKFLKMAEIQEGKEKSDKMINELKDVKLYRLELLHNYKSENKLIDVYFEDNEESLGTNAFVERMGNILYTIEKQGILIIDEIETRLHPYLTNFINLYINCSTNKGAQVIFTTHCYNLLDLQESKLRHEQIWFTQRKDDQSTELFSLADFAERKDPNLNIMKRYFEGRYGAKPFVDFEVINK